MSVVMALKRKRSFDELPSSPLSLASTLRSPSLPDHGGGSSPFTLAADETSPRARLANPCHLHSRTLKRFRDNRPSEEEVHQRTLQLLYTGQRRQQQQDQADVELPQPQQQMEHGAATASSDCGGSHGQQSLHQFWNIASRPTPPPSASSTTAEHAMHTNHQP